MTGGRWFHQTTWCDEHHQIPLEVAIHRTLTQLPPTQTPATQAPAQAPAASEDRAQTTRTQGAQALTTQAPTIQDSVLDEPATEASAIEAATIPPQDPGNTLPPPAVFTPPTMIQTPAPPHILPYRGYRLNEGLKMYRITIDFAEAGDCHTLIRSFRYPNECHETYEKDSYRIPIGYAWKFFTALVDAAIHIDDFGVVHRDLRLENILFTVERGEESEGEKTDGKADEDPGDDKMEKGSAKPIIEGGILKRPDKRKVTGSADLEEAANPKKKAVLSKAANMRQPDDRMGTFKPKPVMDGWRLKPMIGDFGSALPINPGTKTIRNRTDFDELGYRDFKAPEEYHIFLSVLSRKRTKKAANDKTNEAEVYENETPVDQQAPEVNEDETKIDEKATVFHSGYLMHQFLMAGQSPREPLDRKDDLMEDGLQDKTVWKYDKAHDDGPQDLKRLSSWLFCKKIEDNKRSGG